MKNRINLFLDTTPRQWGQKFAYLIPELRIPRFKSVATACLSISLIVHAGILARLFVHPSGASLFDDTKDAVEISLIEGEGPTTKDVEPVYDDESTIVIPVKKKKHEDKELSAADRLLQAYGGMTIAKKDSVAADKKGENPNQRFVHTNSMEAQTGDLAKSVALAAKEKREMGSSKDEMNQYLAHYQNRFQTCYESALLRDSSLNGRVRFAMRAGSAGEISNSEVRFDGVGMPDTKSQLQGCLQTIVQEIRLPAKFASFYGRTIQFQAVLSL